MSMGNRRLWLKVLRGLAAIGVTVVGLMAIVPLLTGWRGPSVDRQALLQGWLNGAHPSRAAVKLVSTRDASPPEALGIHSEYVWVMAASGPDLAGLTSCPATFAEGWAPAGSPDHLSVLGGCFGTWPAEFEGLPDHPSPPSWWPLQVLPDWQMWAIAPAAVAALVLLALGRPRRPSRSRTGTVASTGAGAT